MNRWAALLFALLFPALSAFSQDFEKASPESHGIRSDGLRQMSEWVRSESLDVRSMIVLRNGKLILEWYAGGVDREMNHNIFSITKSVVSTMAGVAMAERQFRSLDVTAGDVLGIEGDFKNVALAHLLTMRSGLPQSRANNPTGPERELFDRIVAAPDCLAEIAKLEVVNPPGETFAYSNIDPQLVSAMIEAEYGERIIDVAREKLFQPLGFNGARWVYADKTGTLPGGYGLRLRPIDMAKLGQLFLQGGDWNGRQILPVQWVLDSVTDQTGSNYGYFWWTNVVGGKSFAAKGVRGQQILVVPEKMLVFVVTADLPPDRVKGILGELNETHLLASVASENRLPANPNAQSALEAELAIAAEYRPEHREDLPPARLPRYPDDAPSPSPLPETDHVMVAAHRGGYLNDKKDGAPENTIANLELAIEKGFDVYETDIQRTKDGHFVIVHDPTIERETNGAGSVAELTLEEVKKLRKRYRDGSLSDEPVPTLEELLQAGKDRILFKPDLKPGMIDHFTELAELIVKLGMEEQVFVRTGMKDADAISDYFAAGVPKIEVMFKVDRSDQVRKIAERFSPATIQINYEKKEKLSEKKRKAIRLARELDILVETHSYGDEEQWKELAEAGVRMFHTAVPDKTLKWLEENGRRD